MKAAIGAFLLLLAALVQSLVPATAWLGMSKPPCLLGVVLYYALTHQRTAVIVVAILAGITQDSLSLIPIGFSAFCFTGIGLAVVGMREVLFRESVVTVALLGAMGGAMTTLALYAMLAVGTDTVSAPMWWLGVKMGGNALLGLVAAPAFWLIAWVLEHQAGIVHSEHR